MLLCVAIVCFFLAFANIAIINLAFRDNQELATRAPAGPAAASSPKRDQQGGDVPRIPPTPPPAHKISQHLP